MSVTTSIQLEKPVKSHVFVNIIWDRARQILSLKPQNSDI